MLSMPCDTDRENVQSQSAVLVWKAKEGNSGCEESMAIVSRSRQTNGEADPDGEAQGSVRAQGLYQALLMQGLLLSFVGLRVSESSAGATRCQSFRLSHFIYHDQADGGYKMQEPALLSTCAQQCHTASVALWGLHGQPENIVLTSLWLKIAAPGRYLLERKQLGKAAIVAPSCTFLFICG